MSEIMLHISDMDKSPIRLKEQILARIESGATITVWTPSDFLALGSCDVVDKTLQRLVHTEELRRIDRGLYDKPRTNKLTQQDNPPNPKAVIDAVVRRNQIRVRVDGMTAAYDLGK